jgi:hypothetical protein
MLRHTQDVTPLPPYWGSAELRDDDAAPRPQSRAPRRRARVVRRGPKGAVRWVQVASRPRADAPSIQLLAEHDPLLALAMIAPHSTVLAAIAADSATIRVVR